MTATRETANEDAARTIETATADASAGAAKARGTAAQVGTLVATVGKAYADGVLELGRSLGGYGSDLVAEASAHLRATARATSLREIGAVQVAWAQNGVQITAIHARELVVLARTTSEETLAPVAALLTQDRPS